MLGSFGVVGANAPLHTPLDTLLENKVIYSNKRKRQILNTFLVFEYQIIFRWFKNKEHCILLIKLMSKLCDCRDIKARGRITYQIIFGIIFTWMSALSNHIRSSYPSVNHIYHVFQRYRFVVFGYGFMPMPMPISGILREALKNVPHVIGSKAGMHNIRPAGQMWPAEAFNLARANPNFASFFDKNTL